MTARLHAIGVIALLAAGCAASGGGAPPSGVPVLGTSLGMQPGEVVTAPVPSPRQLEIAGNPVLGAADAPVTIVEFIDYECPYCQRFARDTQPQIKERYIDTGKVRYVARDFPLPQHKRARPAAIAAACAGEQGRFWEMHDALLVRPGRLDEADFLMHAVGIGLDRERFDACRAEARHAGRLDADFAAARALGVGGTPTFLVGASRGQVAQGELLDGDEDFAEFEKVLER